MIWITLWGFEGVGGKAEHRLWGRADARCAETIHMAAYPENLLVTTALTGAVFATQVKRR